MNIGFIGVGNIGSPIAQQILNSGYSLVVHDLQKEKADLLLENGADWATSPQMTANQCEFVFSCLPGPKEMKEVVLGDHGIVKGAKPGSVYIDLTTNSPTLVQDVHAHLGKKSIAMLDAPISGGMEGAKTRDVLVMVGGDEVTFNRVKPLLDAIGKNIVHVGDIGAGCVAKLCHNSAASSARQAMVEAMCLAVKTGVTPDKIIEIFNKGAIGNNFDLRIRMAETIFRGDFNPRFSLNLLAKDMRLATELAEEYDVDMIIAKVTLRDIESAISKNLGDMDSTISLTLLEERSGVKLRLRH